MLRQLWGAAATVAIVGSAFVVAVPPSATAEGNAPGAELGCDVESLQLSVRQQIAPDARDVVVEAAIELTTPAPETSYCLVEGHVVTIGPGPDLNEVGFAVALPDSFAGRYYFQGVGGSAGIIPPPSPGLLRDGYAVAGTDGGSPTPGVDWRFAIDRTKAYDYGERGVHVAAVATQRITKAFYGLRGSKSLYRYISGCSGGGRMGNAEATTSSRTFDGVILGAPGIDPQNILMFGYVADTVIENPNAWISPAQLAELETAVVDQFDAADGADDDLIWDTTAVTLDPATLGIFNDEQLDLLDTLINGLDLPGGRYPGFGLANPIGWSSFITGVAPAAEWGVTAPPPAGFLVFDSYTKGLYGLDYDFTTDFEFDDEQYVLDWRELFDDVYAASGEADPADMKQFQRAGGKLLIWHGVADNAISFNDTLEWASGLTDLTPRSDVDSWARVFPVPGMLHCGGGIGPTSVDGEALDAIVSWVEDGVAPDSLVAANPNRTFLLCPHPQRSVFAGGVDNPDGLDVTDASNWTCQAGDG